MIKIKDFAYAAFLGGALGLVGCPWRQWQFYVILGITVLLVEWKAHKS